MAALTDGTGAITVNVGGTVYMTTLATLTRVEGSMLGAMADEAVDLDGMGWAVRMGSHTWDGPGGGQGGEDIEDIDWDARLKGYECTVAKLCSETSMLDTVPRVDLSAL